MDVRFPATSARETAPDRAMTPNAVGPTGTEICYRDGTALFTE